MTLSDFTNLIDKLCYHKYIYYILTIFYITVNIPFVFNYNLYSKKSWVVFLGMLFVYVLIIFIIIQKRMIPKFKNGEIGIIFSIDMDDEKQYSLINSKFVKVFRYKLMSKNKNYKVIMLNSFIAERANNKYFSAENYSDFCKKTNSKIMIYGRSVSGNEKEQISCKLNLKSVVSHRPIPHLNSAILAREMAAAFMPITDIAIFKNSETSDFEKNAIQLNFAVDYILASTHLVSSEFDEAVTVFLRLKNEVLNCKSNGPVINFINFIVDDRITFCYNHLANIEILKYYEDENTSHLTKMKKYLDKSCEYINNSYDYKLLIAIYYFISDRDISSALKHIEDCKNYKNEDGWKFSKVFLKLYRQDSMSNFMNAYKVYSRSFLKSKLTFEFVSQILDFIVMIYEKEPNKKQLTFLLFLLYYYIGDEGMQKKYYDEFVLNYSSLIDNENFKNILNKLELTKEPINLKIT